MAALMQRFQIKDLEEFSGVKAHTIRMWERRYGLLSPDRTSTNIRTYGIDELKAIMNVAFLNQHGYKISKIASLSAAERDRLVRTVAVSEEPGPGAIGTLKMAMLSFDEVLFESVSGRYREEHSFTDLIEQVYVPLLEQIGVLWQTSSICPAHEHFISNLIRQKLLMAINGLPLSSPRNDRIHILYLPENELHELGLLYVNYLLRLKGERTIYLGQSVPHKDLEQLTSVFREHLVLITIVTTEPQPSEVPRFLAALRAMIPSDRADFWIAGQQMGKVDASTVPSGIRTFHSMGALLQAVNG